MKKFRVTFWYASDFPTLEEVKIKDETKSLILIDGQWENKRSESRSYYDSRDEAAKEMIELQKKRIDELSEQLEMARDILAQMEDGFFG